MFVIFIIIVLLAITSPVWGCYLIRFIPFSHDICANTEVAGQLGDSFGVVTAIVTTGAFVLLYQTYKFQKTELKNIKEFTERQTHLNVIFQMCEQYRDIILHTRCYPRGTWNTENNKDTGREGINLLISHVVQLVYNDKVATDELKKIEEQSDDIIADYIIKMADIHFNSCKMLFDLLYWILKFIDNLKLPEEEKQNYASIPRAMLSNIELEAILINCLTCRNKNIKQYIEKYSILNNYIPSALEDGVAEAFRGRYDSNAFGKDN